VITLPIVFLRMRTSFHAAMNCKATFLSAFFWRTADSDNASSHSSSASSKAFPMSERIYLPSKVIHPAAL
jgi:hypothetical protein